MRVLRYVALLALVIWIGGLIILGGLVPVTAFEVVDARQVAAGRMLVGALFAVLLERYHLVAYVCAGVLMATLVARRLLGPRPRRFGVRVGLLGLLIAMTLYSGLALTGRVEALQTEIGVPASTLPSDDPQRTRFARLHGLSVGLVIATVAGGLFLLWWEAADGTSEG